MKRFKKSSAVSAALAAAVLCSHNPVFANASFSGSDDGLADSSNLYSEGEHETYKCGKNCFFETSKLDDNTYMLKIFGEGEMLNFSEEENAWEQISDIADKISLISAEGISAVSDNAFEDFFNVKEIEISDSVLQIGEDAFGLQNPDLTVVCSEGSAAYEYAKAKGLNIRLSEEESSLLQINISSDLDKADIPKEEGDADSGEYRQETSTATSYITKKSVVTISGSGSSSESLSESGDTGSKPFGFALAGLGLALAAVFSRRSQGK